MTSRHALASCLALPLLPLLLGTKEPVPRDEGLILVPHAVAGGELRVVLDQELDVSFESLTCRLGGAEVPAEYLPQLKVELDHDLHVVMQERVLTVEDGSATGWTRSFEEIEATFDQVIAVEPEPGESIKAAGESPLLGHAVRFGNDGGSVSCEDPDDVLDEAVLAGLRSDGLFASLLPEGSVSIGDRWELDGEASAALLAPLGDLALEWDEDVDVGTSQDEVDWDLVVEADGWEQGEDGSTLLRLAIQGERIGEEASSTDLDQVPVADGTATERTETTHGIEGYLLWDVEHGTARRLNVEGPIEIRTVTTKDPGQAGPDFESTVLLRGRWALAVEID